MTKSEVKKAESMLADRVQRTEISGVEGGGLCLSVVFNDGHQKTFYTLEAVESFISERR